MKRLPSTNTAVKPLRNQGLNGAKKALLTKGADGNELSVEEKALDDLMPMIGEITGTAHASVSDRITCQIACVLDDLGAKEKCSADAKIVSALELIKELGPEDVTQSMLAGQMIACHNAAMKFMKLALHPGQPSEFVGTPHAERRGWLRNNNPPGDFRTAPRCLARTRRETLCQDQQC